MGYGQSKEEKAPTTLEAAICAYLPGMPSPVQRLILSYDDPVEEILRLLRKENGIPVDSGLLKPIIPDRVLGCAHVGDFRPDGSKTPRWDTHSREYYLAGTPKGSCLWFQRDTWGILMWDSWTQEERINRLVRDACEARGQHTLLHSFVNSRKETCYPDRTALVIAFQYMGVVPKATLVPVPPLQTSAWKQFKAAYVRGRTDEELKQSQEHYNGLVSQFMNGHREQFLE